MPRKAHDDRLETRTARLRLTPRHSPYWRNIQEGRAIGYRRPKAGVAGQWQARFIDHDEAGKRLRKFNTLGTADDLLEADGKDTLSFGQAQEQARKWFIEVTEARRGTIKPITVSEALADYLLDYTARGAKDLKGVHGTINAHIIPHFGKVKVTDLTPNAIRTWHQALAKAPRRLRQSKKLNAKKTEPKPIAPLDADGQRARRASANRILTVLKAALNLAYADGRVLSDDAWRRVKPFKGAESARIRFLTDAEAIRLTNAVATEFRPMVVAALLTGARYGELTRLEARDYNADVGSLHFRETKTRKARHITLTDEGKRFFTERCAGKAGDAYVLPKSDGKEWQKSDQIRPMRAACIGGSISPAIGFHILRHTYASRLAMAGVPLGVIASQLGNSEAICARHYAHLSPGYVSDSIRAASTPLGIVPASNVTPMPPHAPPAQASAS
jgi:integrase